MPSPIYIMQNSFTGGEFSTALDGRQDLQKYASGCKTMKNFFATPQGGATNRPGTKFIAETKDSSKVSRLIPFVFSETTSYVLEFGDYYIRFYKDGEQLLSSSVPYEVVTPYAADEVADIKYTQSADVLYMTHPNYQPRTLSRLGDTSWTLALFAFKLGPFSLINLTDTTITPSGTSGSITLTASSSIFNANMVGGLFKLDQAVEAQAINVNLTAITTTSTIRGMGTWTLTTHGVWAAKLYLERSKDNGTTWKIIRSHSSAGAYNIADSGTEEDEIVMLRVRLYSFTSGTCNIDLEFQPYTSYGIVSITGYTSGTVVTGTVTQELGSTDATTDWYEGSWNDNRGYPSAVVFYQNRLVFANTTKEPQTLWSSQTGDYVNFGVSFSVVDSDAITTPLVSDKVNAVKSLKALSKIIGLTAGGYWVIGGSDSSSVFTPSNQDASAEGNFGASSLDPLIVGNRILFAGSKGSVIRDMGYDIQSYTYVATDLTIYGEHLFKNRTITEWTFAQDPHNIAYCVGSDGVLLALTYLKEQSVAAWSRFITDGNFESTCSIPGTNRDEPWFIVNRTIDGATKRYIERMDSRIKDATYSTNSDGEEIVVYDPKESYFVDCGKSYSFETATTVLTGLEHLEGKSVTILADGNVHPNKTVSSGSITLDYEAKIVHVGLGYVCDLEPLNIDFQAQDGTIQTRYKKISNVSVRLEQSRGANIGSNFNKLYPLKMRSNEAYNEPIALFTGDKEIAINSSSSKNGRICIRMDQPLPITVLAIVYEVSLDG